MAESSRGGAGSAGGPAGGAASDRERRLLRLLQVREQSKDIAKKLRCRTSEEKNKQLALASARKYNEFEGLKKKSLTSLQQKYEDRLSSMGDSHGNAISVEEYQKKEWTTQKEFNIQKAAQRGRTAAMAIQKKKVQPIMMRKIEKKEPSKLTVKGDKNVETKDPVGKVTEYYEENNDVDNCCSNVRSNIRADLHTPSSASQMEGSKLLGNRKNVLISDRQEYSNRDNNSLPITQEQSENIPSKSPFSNWSANDQISITDIEKALCTCQPHLKTVVTSVEHLFNNNNRDKLEPLVDSPSLEKIRFGNYQYKNNENLNYMPLNIVSEFLKNREVPKESQSSELRTEENRDAEVQLLNAKDVIHHSKFLLTSKFSNNPHQSSLQPEGSPLKSFNQKRQSNLFKTKSYAIPHTSKERSYHLRKINTNNKHQPITNVRRRIQSKFKENLIKSASPQRSVKYYDLYNKFSKNILVNDEDLVESLPKGEINAFESAEKEIESDRIIANALRLAKINDRSKERGQEALKKVRVEGDYQSLLKELEMLTKEEKVIGKRLPEKVFKGGDRAQLEELRRQKHMNMSVESILNKIDDPNAANTRIRNSNVENIKNKTNVTVHREAAIDESSVNVATWDVYNDSKVLNSDEKLTLDSESSTTSIIFHRSTKAKMTNNNQNIKKPGKSVDSQRKTTLQNPKRNLPNMTSKVTNPEYTNSTEDETSEEIHRKMVKKAKTPIPVKLNNKNLIYDKKNVQHMPSSTSSTVSFEGLQIIIEVKKSKKESEKVKTTKNERVQTVEEKCDSSNEVSIKTSKMVANKKGVILERTNSLHRFDSSESTTYMSPPDKITTNFEHFFKKGFQVAKDKSVFCDNHKIGQINKAVNTDAIDGSRMNIISENEKFLRNEEDSQRRQNVDKRSIDYISASKGVQVDFVAHEKHISSNVDKPFQKIPSKIEIDPKIKHYIKRLLGMSENEIQALNIDVSDVSTPSSSIINMSSNFQPSQSFYDKINRLQKFIKENYALLEEFKKSESLSKVNSLKHTAFKPTSRSSSSSSLSNEKNAIQEPDIANSRKSNFHTVKSSTNKSNKSAQLNASKSQPNLSTKAFEQYSKEQPGFSGTIFQKSKTQATEQILSLDKSKDNKFTDFITQPIAEMQFQKYSTTSPLLVSDKHANKSINEAIVLCPETESVTSQEVSYDKKLESLSNLNIGDNSDGKNTSVSLDDEIKIIQGLPDLSSESHDKNENNISEELKQLSKVYTKRILNLTQQLDQVRKEKRLMSSSSSSSGEETVINSQNKTADEEFIPILNDIPKPNNSHSNVIINPNSMREELCLDPQSITLFSLGLNPHDSHRPKTTPIKNKELFSLTPHELSTIIEVDTPVTLKNSSLPSRNIDSTSTTERHRLIPISLNFSAEGSHINQSSSVEDEQIPDISAIKLEDSVKFDVNIKPFISFQDFVQQDNMTNTKLADLPSENKSVESSLESNDNLHATAVAFLKQKLISTELMSDSSNTDASSAESSLSISELISSNRSSLLKKFESFCNNQLKRLTENDISGVQKLQSSSDSLSSELENLIKSFGPDGMTTWKKIQEAQALSPSSSSSHLQSTIPNTDILSKIIDDTGTSVGLSTLRDDFNLSDNFFKRNVGDISNTSLHKKLNELQQQLKSNKSYQKDTSGERAVPSTSKKTDKIITSEQTVVDSENISNKEKTHQRTSTPVKLLKSSSSSSNGQFSFNNASTGLFVIESDLSSVKNFSNSDKTVSSNDRLSVPNATLKFGKLFDNSLQSEK